MTETEKAYVEYKLNELHEENEKLKKQIEKSISKNARLTLAINGWFVCYAGYDKALEEQKQIYREELNNL